MTFDEIRAKFPAFGFALYAYTPGGPVRFEALDPDGIHRWEFEAETEQAVLERAFPPEQPPEDPAQHQPEPPAPVPPRPGPLEIDWDALSKPAANIAKIFDIFD